MTTESTPVVKLSTPLDVLGALPYLVGFHPSESLVVVCLQGPRKRTSVTMRFDLPNDNVDSHVAAQIAAHVTYAQADAVLLVCYSDAPADDGPPQRGLIDRLTTLLAIEHVEVAEALLVHLGRWFSYNCTPPCDGACGGTLPAELTSAAAQLAAEATVRGRAVLSDRSELARSIAPDDGPTELARLKQALQDVSQESWSLTSDTSVGREGIVPALKDLCERYALGERRVSDHDAAAVALGLRDVRARDRALTLVLDDDAGVLLPVLTDVARRTPPEAAAPVCTALAFAALAHGSGALANVALDRALACDPGYALARLLTDAADQQLSPSFVRQLAKDVRAVLSPTPSASASGPPADTTRP